MTKVIRSVERSLDVLEAIARNGPSSLALLTNCTGLSKTTLHRLCRTMEARHWLTQRSADGRYQFGPRFPNVGGNNEIFPVIGPAAKEIIVNLSKETELAVDLAAAVGGGRVEFVDTTRRFAKHNVNAEMIGFRPSPLRSAVGSAYLAALDDEIVAKIIRDLRKISPREERSSLVRAESIVENTRGRGYGVREAGYWGRAVDYGALPMAIAVPVMGRKKPVGSINLVWDAEKFTVPYVVEKFLIKLLDAATIISERCQEKSL